MLYAVLKPIAFFVSLFTISLLAQNKLDTPLDIALDKITNSACKAPDKNQKKLPKAATLPIVA